jgi:prevent-host-death family protein
MYEFRSILDLKPHNNSNETAMKPLRISEDIMSIYDFKNHASKVLSWIQSSNRPIVITQNGKATAVLMAPAEYDRLSEHARFITAVYQGLDDVKKGRINTDEEMDKVLEEAYLD